MSSEEIKEIILLACIAGLIQVDSRTKKLTQWHNVNKFINSVIYLLEA